MMQFQEERLWAAAQCDPGAARTASTQTADYTRERQTFGQAILDNQVVHFRLAELKTEVEALRGADLHGDRGVRRRQGRHRWASMAKLKAGRLVREVPDACLQYWGGMGFTWDNPVARLYRDGRLGSIGGGADEIMLGIICQVHAHAAAAPLTSAPSTTLFRDSVRRFVEREIAPHVDAWDEAETFPRELYARAAEAGLLGLGYPEASAARRPTAGA